jgi:hypothetical protein
MAGQSRPTYSNKVIRFAAGAILVAACGESEARRPQVKTPSGGETSSPAGAAGLGAGGIESASAGEGGDALGGSGVGPEAGGGLAATDAGEAGAGGSPSSGGTPLTWWGSIGTRCGADDREAVVLLASPEPKSCAERSADLSGDGESFVRAELPTTELDGPIELTDVSARHCADSACADTRLTLELAPQGDPSELRGTFAVRFASGEPPLAGTLTVANCPWNEFLPSPALDPGVRNLELRGLAAFQGVKVPLMERGTALPANRARVVADRAALFRAYVVPDAEWVPRTVRARLTLENGRDTLQFIQERFVAAPSSDDSLASTFNYEVEPALIRPDTRYSIELFEAEACAAAGERRPGRYPAEGSAALQPQVVGGLSVVIVPIRLQTRGQLVPDTSPEQIAHMRAALLGLFPISELEIAVREAPLDSGATSVLELIDELAALRELENPGRRTSYYGLFRFTETLDQYCAGPCVLGAGINGDPAAPQAGTAVGVGYTGDAAARTFAHELGHVYGREHTPCGVAGDPQYPYSGGRTGVWGYDFARKLLMPPELADFMGYCQPYWVSDHVFGQLAEYIEGVNAELLLIGTPAPLRFRTILLEAGRAPRFGRARAIAGTPSGRPEAALAYPARGAPLDVVVYRASVGHGNGEADLVYAPDPAEHGWLGIGLSSGQFVPHRASLP